MKLQPVYLVAPMPAPKSMPTRRAWLLATGAFAVGAVAGSACQSWLGGDDAAPAPEPEPEPAAQAALDPMQEWLRKVCDDGTGIEELIRHRLSLYMQLPKWRDDPLLWHGIDRLASVVLETAELADRRRLAFELSLFLQNAELPAGASDRWDLDALLAIARGG